MPRIVTYLHIKEQKEEVGARIREENESKKSRNTKSVSIVVSVVGIQGKTKGKIPSVNLHKNRKKASIHAGSRHHTPSELMFDYYANYAYYAFFKNLYSTNLRSLILYHMRHNISIFSVRVRLKNT